MAKYLIKNAVLYGSRRGTCEICGFFVVSVDTVNLLADFCGTVSFLALQRETNGLAEKQTDRRKDRQAGRQTDRPKKAIRETGRPYIRQVSTQPKIPACSIFLNTDRQTDGQKDIDTCRQADRQTDRHRHKHTHTEKQTDRQTETETDRQTDRYQCRRRMDREITLHHF